MLSNPLYSKADNVWPRSLKLVFVICLIGFFVQLYKITERYYSYETEIQTKLVNGNGILNLPAITLCTEPDVQFLKSTLRKKDPQLVQQLKSLESLNESVGAREMLKDRCYLHSASARDYKTFFDLSIKDGDFVKCYLNKPTVWMEKQGYNLPTHYCSAFNAVLESRVRYYGKCFTYFSRQHTMFKDVSDLQVNTESMSDYETLIYLLLSMDRFNDVLRPAISYLSKREIFMFIHDSTRMPSFDPIDAIELKPGMVYDIQFWSTGKQLLKHPYPSDCFDYTKNLMAKELPKSKDQCLRDCVIEKSANGLNCVAMDVIVANDHKLNENYSNRKICRLSDDLMYARNIGKHCMRTCRKECFHSDYHLKSQAFSDNIDIISRIFESGSKRINSSLFTFVSLRYKKDNDNEEKERPVHSLCHTMQQMFVTLLIWFGLSIFSLFSSTKTALTKAKPHFTYLQSFDDRVGPNVLSVATPSVATPVVGQCGPAAVQPMIKPQFMPTNIGSNVKLDHFNQFISKVVDGCPNAQVVDLTPKKN